MVQITVENNFFKKKTISNKQNKLVDGEAEVSVTYRTKKDIHYISSLI